MGDRSKLCNPQSVESCKAVENLAEAEIGPRSCLSTSSFGPDKSLSASTSLILDSLSVDFIGQHPKTILDRLVDFLSERISTLEKHVTHKLTANQELEEELARLARAKKLQSEAIDLQRLVLEGQPKKILRPGLPPLETISDSLDRLQVDKIQEIHSEALALQNLLDTLEKEEDKSALFE